MNFGAVVCAPRSGLAQVFAAIVSGIFIYMTDAEPGSVLVTVIVAIMLTSIVTGLLLILLEIWGQWE